MRLSALISSFRQLGMDGFHETRGLPSLIAIAQRAMSGDAASSSQAAAPAPAPASGEEPASQTPEGMSLHMSGATLDFSKPAAQNPAAVGVAHVYTTKNNTIITLTDMVGRTRTWASAGTVGERNARKGTAFAAETAAMTVGKKALELGIDVVKVKIKGIGQGRDSSVKGLKMAGVRITKIVDVTPIPHNGCRPKKKRRM